MQIAYYIRVSRRDQSQAKARGFSALERQQFEIERAIALIGGDPAKAQRFEDQQSGRRDDRVALTALLELVKAKAIDAVVVRSVDRLARNVRFNEDLWHLFKKSGVKLYEIYKSDFINFEDISEWERFTQAGVSAQGESMRLSKRVKTGMEFLRHQGKPNPKPPFGYRIENGSYVLDDTPWSNSGVCTWQVAQDCIQIIESAGSFAKAQRQIFAKWEKQWNDSGLGFWFHNATLRGYTQYKRQGGQFTEKRLTHPSAVLLTEERYEAICQQLKSNQLGGGSDRIRTYPLTGLLFCSDCKSRLSISFSQSASVQYSYGFCRARLSSNLNCEWANQKNPHWRQGGERKGIRLDIVEDAVIDKLVVKANELIEAAIEALQQEEPDQEHLRIDRDIAKVKTLIAQIGDDDGLLAQKIISLQNQKVTKRVSPNAVKAQVLRERLKALNDRFTWVLMTPEERKIVFHDFVESIYICKGQIDQINLSRLL